MSIEEQRHRRDTFARWLWLLSWAGAIVTAVLMGYYFLFAPGLSFWLTWCLIGSQVLTLVSLALWFMIDRD